MSSRNWGASHVGKQRAANRPNFEERKYDSSAGEMQSVSSKNHCSEVPVAKGQNRFVRNSRQLIMPRRSGSWKLRLIEDVKEAFLKDHVISHPNTLTTMAHTGSPMSPRNTPSALQTCLPALTFLENFGLEPIPYPAYGFNVLIGRRVLAVLT